MRKKVDKVLPIKIMVASTAYHFENELEQICGTLTNYGYKVINSHIGTVFSLGGQANPQECLAAVQECDFFLGIIRPVYSSGITHLEIKKAVELNKPRCFLVHRDVPFARKLLEPYIYSDVKNRIKNPDFIFKKTSVMDKVEVIQMYNDAIQDDIPLNKRSYHWAQEFYRLPDLLTYIEAQFKDIDRIRQQLK